VLRDEHRGHQIEDLANLFAVNDVLPGAAAPQLTKSFSRALWSFAMTIEASGGNRWLTSTSGL
jgi:hypothetical protein